jgi:3-dehydroquinate dehydratase/shikimate dehydrogenase
MGKHGEISRILSPIIGSYLTFGSLEEGKESAQGQIPARVLKDVYRIDKLVPDVNIYGLVGNPVSESMGYLIHNRAFGELGLNNIYLPFLVDDLNSFISGFNGLYKGLSVTMPFKEDIIPLLDEVDKEAEDIGAVNTVVVEDNKLIGYNTDCHGAMMALEDREGRTWLDGKNGVMIGAGGGARAIGFGVKRWGVSLTITDIDMDKAVSLSKDIGCEYCNLDELGNIKIDILINTTPVGMYPNVDKSPVPDSFLKEGMIVFDAVYNPLKTRLLKEAEAKGCIIIPGVEMFINQGVAQFEMWTKRNAPINIMREVVLDKLR